MPRVSNNHCHFCLSSLRRNLSRNKLGRTASLSCFVMSSCSSCLLYVNVLGSSFPLNVNGCLGKRQPESYPYTTRFVLGHYLFCKTHSFPRAFLSEMKAVGYILFPSATNLLCFAIAMAASEDPAFAAISKQEYFLLLRSVKLAPRSKSRRVIVA